MCTIWLSTQAESCMEGSSELLSWVGMNTHSRNASASYFAKHCLGPPLWLPVDLEFISERCGFGDSSWKVITAAINNPLLLFVVVFTFLSQAPPNRCYFTIFAQCKSRKDDLRSFPHSSVILDLSKANASKSAWDRDSSCPKCQTKQFAPTKPVSDWTI